MLGLQFCGLTGLVLLESNLLKYPHKLEIEGEIALYHSTAKIVTRRIIGELTEKKDYLYHVKRIINSAYIFVFLCCFSFSYRNIDF